MATGRQIIHSALRKVNASSANSVATDEDIQLALETLNTLIDSKSNDFLNVHQIKQRTFQFTAGKVSYLLGPTGDWKTDRPMRVEKARLLMNPKFMVADFIADVTEGDAPLGVTFQGFLV